MLVADSVLHIELEYGSERAQMLSIGLASKVNVDLVTFDVCGCVFVESSIVQLFRSVPIRKHYFMVGIPSVASFFPLTQSLCNPELDH